MDFSKCLLTWRTGATPFITNAAPATAEDVRWIGGFRPHVWLPKSRAHRTLCPAGRRHCDGIPCAFFESIGHRCNLVVLTQPKGYKKEEQVPARYPGTVFPLSAFLDAVADRHERYLSMWQQAGVGLCDPHPHRLTARERDPARSRCAHTGRAPENQIHKIQTFLSGLKAAPRSLMSSV